MASLGAWFMPKGTSSLSSSAADSFRSDIRNKSNLEEHQRWPWILKHKGQAYNQLELYIQQHTAKACNVEKFEFGGNDSGTRKLGWHQKAKISTKDDLKTALQKQKDSSVESTLYIVTEMSAEVMQMLGHYLDVTPRFFNFPYAMLSTGPTCAKYMFVGLQFMEKYKGAFVPTEAQRVADSPSISFRTKKGPSEWTWYVTRIALVCTQSASNNGKYDALCWLDGKDNAIIDAYRCLVGSYEEGLIQDIQTDAGLSQLVNELFYLVAFSWGVFLGEAEAYLQNMSREIVLRDASAKNINTIIGLTQDLHQVAPLWVQVRRRILCARDAADQITTHPFFAQKRSSAIKGFLVKRIRTLEDQMRRAQELTEQTNVLISLIFNLTTLQDTRIAVEQNKHALNLTLSISRISTLTFFYLPLTFVCSIFGMNLQEINSSKIGLVTYIITAVSFTALTLVALALWAFAPRIRRLISRRLRRQKKSPRTRV